MSEKMYTSLLPHRGRVPGLATVRVDDFVSGLHAERDVGQQTPWPEIERVAEELRARVRQKATEQKATEVA